MTARRPRMTLLTAVLTLCNAGLVSALCVQWWQGSQRDALLMVPPAQLQVPRHNFGTAADQDASGDLQARAVFHASRSFYVAPVPEMQAQTPPDYRLAGVIRLPNKPAAAILISNQAGVRTKVEVGGQIEGWSIDEIRADRILVSLQGQQSEIGAKSTTASSSSPAPGSNTPGLTLVASGQVLQPKAAVPISGKRVLSAPSSGASSAAAGDPGGRLYRPPTR